MARKKKKGMVEERAALDPDTVAASVGIKKGNRKMKRKGKRRSRRSRRS